MRILKINAKCDDRCLLRLTENNVTIMNNGYVPYNIGIGGGDYLKFEIDADTGQILNWQAITSETLQNEE